MASATFWKHSSDWDADDNDKWYDDQEDEWGGGEEGMGEEKHECKQVHNGHSRTRAPGRLWADRTRDRARARAHFETEPRLSEGWLLSCLSPRLVPAEMDVHWGSMGGIGSRWEGRLSLLSYSIARSLSQQPHVSRHTAELLMAACAVQGDGGCEWLHGYVDFLDRWRKGR